jgi:hypothetical protein
MKLFFLKNNTTRNKKIKSIVNSNVAKVSQNLVKDYRRVGSKQYKHWTPGTPVQYSNSRPTVQAACTQIQTLPIPRSPPPPKP